MFLSVNGMAPSYGTAQDVQSPSIPALAGFARLRWGNTAVVTSHSPHAERLELEGVSETTLWTLYRRASEAARPDAVLHDPMAIDLVRTIDFPFAERFGTSAGWAQWQALRARTFDREVRRFLRDHPDGTVVALGEGLETQFWRVNNGHVRWVSVDLPQVIELRRRLLPESPRMELIGSPVADGAWLDEIDARTGIMVTAQGLLMYLRPDEVRSLIAGCADRIRDGALLFDVVPRWLSDRTQREPLGGAGDYRPPPWTWGLDTAELMRLRALPGIVELRRVRVPRGRGPIFGYAAPLVRSVSWLADRSFAIMRARVSAVGSREAR
jgi:O-methyltransferase involved in polyketide biosynthesis